MRRMYEPAPWGRYHQFTANRARAQFRARIAVNGDCWEWQGPRNRSGYGIVGFMGAATLAHRVAMVLLGGIDVTGRCVLHKCDNPRCVNPGHLWLGTQADNVADMEQKRRGRHPRGEAHGRAKLTAAQVQEVRMAHAGGEGIRSIARRFPVSRRSIARIVHGEGWR
jgi:hypothetical protein